MGIGRQVADAYIDVHGDLSDFRRDLGKAGPMTEAAAREQADNFSDAWGKRIQQDINGKWGSILDAMYSDKQVDWDRMFGEFDPRSLKDARDQVKEFLNDMRQTEQWGKDSEGEPVFEGMKLDLEEAAKMLSRMDEVIAGMNKREKEREDHARNLLGIQQELSGMQDQQFLKLQEEGRIREAIAKAQANLAKAQQEALDMNKEWARTWEGMRKNNAIKDMADDFKKLGEAMSFDDLGKFASGFDSLEKARARIYDVTAAMEDQRRITRAQSEELHAFFQSFMDDQKAQAKATKAALDETNRLREAQDRYNQSLSGMARNIHFAKLEGDFRNLAAAMDSNDFSSFAQGADDIDDMRRAIANTAGEMHRLGRMTDTEYGLILERVDSLTHHFKDNERSGTNAFTALRNGFSRFGAVMSTINNSTRGLREHLQGFAGLNVFGDLIEGGLNFIHNLDRIAVSLGKNTLKFGTMAAAGTSAFAGLVTVAGDLGGVIGGLAVLAPGFLIGAAVQAVVLQAALKDMKTVLKDLAPAFHKLQDSISKKFWAQAEAPIRSMVKTLLPTLTTNLNNTATALGGFFAEVAKQMNDVDPKLMTTMFDRMNRGIGNAKGAVRPLLRAFSALGEAASRYFERFGKWLTDISTKFGNFIEKAAKDGRLTQWIDNAIEGVKDIGRSLDGAMGIFNAINDAAKRAGFEGLKAFADGLQGAAAVMQSPEFQTTLTTYLGAARDLTIKLGNAIQDLGPAFVSLAPTAEVALGKIGDAVSKIIGYVGDIFSNPTFQQGIRDFTTRLDSAIAKLEPAVKPFADSLGNALSLLGKVAESVATIAAAFTITLGPVLDSMSGKIQTLLDPLSGMATNIIEKLKPVAEAFDQFIVGPVVEGLNSDLIPAFNGFVDKAGPVLEKIVKDLGPVISNLVSVVLPGAVKVATELLGPLQAVFDLFTPAFADLLERTGKGFESVAAGMRIVKGEARPEDWGVFTQGFSHEAFDKDVDQVQEKLDKLAHPETMSWKDIWDKALVGDLPFALSAATAKVVEAVGKALAWLGEHIADGWNKTMKFLGEQLSDFGKIFTGENANLNALSDEVDKWIKQQLDNLGRGNEGLSQDITRNLDNWWNGIKGMFQDWFKSTFGFGKDTSAGGGGGSFGGGGGGGKGTGVMGKITEEMLGNTGDTSTMVTEPLAQVGQAINDAIANISNIVSGAVGLIGEVWNSFWGGFGQIISDVWTQITTNIGMFIGQVAANIGNFIGSIGAGWATFWTGLVQVVSDVWTQITTWISTTIGQIIANIGGFIGTVAASWNTFWAGVWQTVSSIWTQITTWISTTVGQIIGNIASFIGTVTSNWNSFWSGVFQTVSSIWTQITGWISGQVGAIMGRIAGFIGTVTSSWNGFWAGVWRTVSNIWSQITGTISSFVGAIIGRISGFGGQVAGIWNGLWANVQGIVRGAWAGIVGAISGGVANAVSFVAGLPGRISGVLSGLGGILVGAGASIMQGFLNGLTSVWNNITGFVGGIAGWIAANKGPLEYDKVLLEPAGQAIMTGLQRGLESKMDPLLNTLQTITALVTDSVTTDLSKSVMYVAGADAAQGLAEGLKANRASVHNALGSLGTYTMPDSQVTVGGALGAVGRPTADSAPSRAFNLAEGAVQVHTQATDPWIIAGTVTDALSDAFSTNSRM